MQRTALASQSFFRSLARIGCLAAVGLLTACSGTPREAGRSSITIDGDISEWSPDVVATADADFLYLRFRVSGSLMTLQAAPETLSILLDADDSASTGAPISELAAASSMGVDLEIQFSPMTDSGTPANGVSAIAIDSTGATERLTHAALDFHFSPTYASEWYECRISRQSTGAGLLSPNILKGRRVRGVLGLYDAAGNISGASEAFTATMPPASNGRALADVPVPATPRGAMRVMSYNVLRSSPASNPGPFTRLVRSINPDVIMIQEWDTDAATIAAWFNTAMPEHAPWTVVATTGLYGVGIVTRHPVVSNTVDGSLMPAVADIGGSDVRFAGAVVRTPMGDVLVGSTHLKCCGTAASSEDVRRMDETRAINAAFGAMGNRSLAMRVIGGDMNLVGSRGPIDVLRTGVDADGSDMEIAPAMVLGDAAYYTWTDAGNAFSPGRLDYVLVGDSQARVVRSFVVDTARLTDAALSASGLERGDSRGSDHMPVVVDLVRK